MEIFAWLMANINALLAVLLGIHAVAVMIVNLTPTPKDDYFVSKAYSVIQVFAGLVTKRSLR